MPVMWSTASHPSALPSTCSSAPMSATHGSTRAAHRSTSSFACRLSRRTTYPRASNSRTVAWPITPLPPVTRTLMWASQGRMGARASYPSFPALVLLSQPLRPEGLLKGIFAIIAVAALMLAACAKASGPVVIATAGPWNESYGASHKRGVELAVEELNKKGGVANRPIRLIDRNDEG